MATNYRNSAGTDFDDVFDPYVQGTVPANTAFRTSDGVDLAGRYAPLSYGSKAPDVNYRTSAGTDVTNLWAAKGTASYAPPTPGFGGDYSAAAQAPSSTSGNTSAELMLVIDANGSWRVEQTLTNAVSGSGTTTLREGTWLRGGGAAGDYQGYFVTSGGDGGVVSNSAPSWASLGTTQTVSLRATVPAASSSTAAASMNIVFHIRKGAGAETTESLSMSVQATGWR